MPVLATQLEYSPITSITRFYVDGSVPTATLSLTKMAGFRNLVDENAELRITCKSIREPNRTTHLYTSGSFTETSSDYQFTVTNINGFNLLVGASYNIEIDVSNNTSSSGGGGVGPTGPVGPVGPAGTVGPTGPEGPSSVQYTNLVNGYNLNTNWYLAKWQGAVEGLNPAGPRLLTTGVNVIVPYNSSIAQTGTLFLASDNAGDLEITHQGTSGVTYELEYRLDVDWVNLTTANSQRLKLSVASATIVDEIVQFKDPTGNQSRMVTFYGKLVMTLTFGQGIRFGLAILDPTGASNVFNVVNLLFSARPIAANV